MSSAAGGAEADRLRVLALRTRSPLDAVAYLSALAPSTIRLGLDRMRAALDGLGSPEARVPALHVAGTNGKGSTCAFAASCLQQRFRTGLYTSPHLSRINERIRVDGADISDELLGRRVLEVLDRLPPEHALTGFELGTLVALWHFAQEKLDVAVLETGLGGRLDATTCCRPLVTAITSISFDHTAHLGASLAAIAAEKAGIIKRGVPVVTCQQAPEVQEVLWSAARAAEAPLFVEGREFSLVPRPGGQLRWTGISGLIDDVRLPLRGRHQHQNAAVAIACLEVLGERRFRLTPREVLAGLAATRWPGRLEEVPGDPPVVLDGAHNPDGVQRLVQALGELYPARPVHLVFGVLADKDSDAMIQALLPRCAAVHLTPVDNPRSRAPESYAGVARSLVPHVVAHPDAPTALAAARASAPKHALVLVAGSLYLVGQLRPLLVAGADR